MVDDPTMLRQIRSIQRSQSPMTLSDTEQMEYMADWYLHFTASLENIENLK